MGLDATGDLTGSGCIVKAGATGFAALHASAGTAQWVNDGGNWKAIFNGTDVLLVTSLGGIARRVTNKSGGILNAGDAVMWDATTAKSVKTTTVQNALKFAGVIYSTSIANDADGWMVFKGDADTKVTGTLSMGDALGFSTTVKNLGATNPLGAAYVATLINTPSGGKAVVALR